MTRANPEGGLRTALVYGGLGAAVLVPIVVAANSPLLQWRQPVYITAGFAGVIGLCLLLIQPLLAADALPELAAKRSRGLHRWVGAALFTMVVVHIIGLWITSPPDVIDALLFRSPTPFSLWGVVAMWAIFGAAMLALFRSRIVRSLGAQKGLKTWRRCHTLLAVLTVAGTVTHALLIEGTMGIVSKWMLCVLVVGVTLWLLVHKQALR